jgi:hypothetical protein
MICSNCKADQAHRAHRRGLIERVLSVVGYYPFCCQKCHLRFLSLHYTPVEETVAGRSNVEREIKATRGAMRAKRKRREVVLYSAAILLFLAFLYYITVDRGNSIDGYAAPAGSHVAAIAS